MGGNICLIGVRSPLRKLILAWNAYIGPILAPIREFRKSSKKKV